MKLICGRPIKTCSKGSCKIDITFISYTRRTRRDFPHLPTTSRSRPRQGPQTNNTASSQKRARSGRRSWTDTEARARSAEQPKKPQTPQTQQGRGFKRMLGELDGKDLRQEWVTPTVLRECQEWGQMGDQLRPPPMTRLNSRTFYLASRRGQGMEKSALNRKHTRHSIRWSTIWKTARNTRIAMEIIAIEKQREGDKDLQGTCTTFSKACSTSQSEVSRRTLKSIAMLERICNDIDRQILQVADLHLRRQSEAQVLRVVQGEGQDDEAGEQRLQRPESCLQSCNLTKMTKGKFHQGHRTAIMHPVQQLQGREPRRQEVVCFCFFCSQLGKLNQL